MVRADSLRGLRRWREAAEAYEMATGHVRDAIQPQAAYAAARIYADRLTDPTAARAALRRGHATWPGSPVEERARILEINVLEELSQNDAREDAIDVYLERFPSTPAADELR